MAAANTDLLRKKKSNFSTTLSAGINDSDTAIPLSSVSGLPTDTAITLTIDRVDSDSVATPAKRERVTGVVSGGGLINCLRGQDNTSAQSHSSGAIVEDIWDAETWNDTVDMLLVEHNQDGTHASSVVKTTSSQTLSNKTLTSPILNGTLSGTAFKDEDDMASDSAIATVSQQSVKKFVEDSIDAISQEAGITVVLYEGGGVLATGIKLDLEVPFDFTIQSVTALADQSGSVVVDIWADTYGNYPPTDADTITASAPVTISSATKSQDSTLTGWDTTLTKGQTLRFNIDSITSITRLAISLKGIKT